MKKPLLVALDLEGTLIPEIWIAVADKTCIPELRLTTRDEPDYDKLMKMRIAVLKKNRLGLGDIQKIIRTIEPLSGALSFVSWLRKNYQIVILSDTFYEFSAPLMEKLGFPMLLCNSLTSNLRGMITGYTIRQKDGKRKAVRAFKQLGFRVIAIGDSYNDTTMLREADAGIFMNAPEATAKQFPKFPACKNYADLKKMLITCA